MSRSWAQVGVLVALLVACGNKSGTSPSPTASGAASATTAAASAEASPSAKSAQGCLTAPDYLVPPQKYHDGDLIRAVLVDGDQVYFRNMDELMRVPLAGGPIVTIGKAPAL